MLGVVEATLKSDEEKNRLCPPISYRDTTADYRSTYLAIIVHGRARAAYPAVNAWAKETRPNKMSGLSPCCDHLRVQETRYITTQFGAAAGNLMNLPGQWRRPAIDGRGDPPDSPAQPESLQFILGCGLSRWTFDLGRV